MTCELARWLLATSVQTCVQVQVAFVRVQVTSSSHECLARCSHSIWCLLFERDDRWVCKVTSIVSSTGNWEQINVVERRVSQHEEKVDRKMFRSGDFQWGVRSYLERESAQEILVVFAVALHFLYKYKCTLYMDCIYTILNSWLGQNVNEGWWTVEARELEVALFTSVSHVFESWSVFNLRIYNPYRLHRLILYASIKLMWAEMSNKIFHIHILVRTSSGIR